MHKAICITTYLFTDNHVLHKAVCLLSIFFFWVVPWRVDIHTPGNYPKEENTRYSQHGESLKTSLFVTYKPHQLTLQWLIM
jgi:hypothetical protein